MTAENEMTVLLYLAGAAFVSSCTFVILYHFRTRGAWRKTATGRNVMLLMSVIVFSFAQIFAVRWLGDYPGRFYVSAALYLLVTYASAQRTFLMLMAQAGRRETPADPRQVS